MQNDQQLPTTNPFNQTPELTPTPQQASLDSLDRESNAPSAPVSAPTPAATPFQPNPESSRPITPPTRPLQTATMQPVINTPAAAPTPAAATPVYISPATDPRPLSPNTTEPVSDNPVQPGNTFSAPKSKKTLIVVLCIVAVAMIVLAAGITITTLQQ